MYMANQCPCWQISPENHRKFGFPGWYFGYIPGTQMGPLVLFEVLDLRVEGIQSPKRIWLPKLYLSCFLHQLGYK